MWKQSVSLSVSVSFAREILSPRARHGKRTWSTIYVIVPGDREENEPCTTVAQFSRSSVDDGRKDGRRSEASGIVEPDTRLWGVDAGCLALLVVRISSRTCPPNVFSARVSTLSGTHYQRVLRIRELDPRIRQDGNSSRLSRNKFARFYILSLHLFFRKYIFLLCLYDINLFERSNDVRS